MVLKKDMNSKITKENKLLYTKIMDIEVKPTELSRTTLLKNYRVTNSNKSFAWRTKLMKKINIENRVIQF
jgi:hypothetical protein